MKIAIVGSRNFADSARLAAVMAKVKSPINMIVSGGARGADSLGAVWAKEHEIPLDVFLPDWDRLGKKAGFVRNRTIVEAADAVIAFWDGASAGTANTIELARKAKKPVHIVRF